MSNYYPDKWVLVELNSPAHGTITKVLASWSGSYTNGDSWKLSSGVVKIIKTDSGYEFINNSGSIYFCSAGMYGMTTYTSSIYQNFVDQISEKNDGTTIKILDEDESEKLCKNLRSDD